MVTREDLINLWTDLTKRERQVMELLAEGMPTRQIAMNMGVTVSTTERHLTGLYEKLKEHEIVENGAVPRLIAVKAYTKLFSGRKVRVW